MRGAAAAVGLPSTALGDPAELLHIDVDHVAGIASDDLLSPFAVGRTGRVQVTAAADAELAQPAGHGCLADPDTLGLSSVTMARVENFFSRRRCSILAMTCGDVWFGLTFGALEVSTRPTSPKRL
ncbi:hypothetical protein Kisp01_70510 [Kineosporia sp. NBRC 101677]|nr:hypothetical protein Kisp01_70510 [Kineosporia sp. NBRC 101677]